MKGSELIKLVQKAIDENGDIDVLIDTYGGGYIITNVKLDYVFSEEKDDSIEAITLKTECLP